MEFSYNKASSVLSYQGDGKPGGCRQGSRTQLPCTKIILRDMPLFIFLAKNGQRQIAGVEYVDLVAVLGTMLHTSELYGEIPLG